MNVLIYAPKRMSVRVCSLHVEETYAGVWEGIWSAINRRILKEIPSKAKAWCNRKGYPVKVHILWPDGLPANRKLPGYLGCVRLEALPVKGLPGHSDAYVSEAIVCWFSQDFPSPSPGKMLSGVRGCNWKDIAVNVPDPF